MARKAQEGSWEQISDLIGRIKLSVSGKAWVDRNGKEYPAIPKTDGFYVEIRYESRADEKYHALCNSRVAVQNTLKQYFWEHGKFPVQPGKVFKATSNGGMELPNTIIVDRAVANAATMDLADKIRLATAMGLPIPAEWLAAQTVAPVNTSNDQGGDDEDDEKMKYPAGTLDRLVIAKLRILAQTEELEGYDELTTDEIRGELYAIEK